MDVDAIVQALAVIYAPGCSNQQRQQAQKLCEDVKEDARSPLIGHHLAHFSRNFDSTVRYFGLTLLENAVRFKWQDYGDNERLQIREAIVDLVRNGLQPTGEKKFIREKLAHIVAEVAERSWPQNWPELNSLLMELFQTSSIDMRELVLNVLKFIAEDTFVFTTSVTVSRKEDIRNALVAIACRAPASIDDKNSFSVPVEIYNAAGVGPGSEGWLSRISSTLAEQIHVYNSLAARRDEAELMMILCINTIAAYLEWVPFETLKESQLIANLFSLISHPSSHVRLASCDAVVIAIVRKYSDWNQPMEVIVEPLLSVQGIETLAKAWAVANGTYSGSEDDMDDHIETNYQFLKRLAQLWVDLGVEHVCNKKADRLPSNFPKYLEFLGVLTGTDSLLINTLAITTWTHLLRHDVTSKSQELQSFLGALVDVLLKRMEKTHYMPNETGSMLGSRYSFADFNDDFAEFQTGFGAYRNLCSGVLKVVAEKMPTELLQKSGALLIQAVQQPLSSASDLTRNKLGLLTTNSPNYMRFESAVTVLQASLHGIRHQKPQVQNGLMPQLLELLQVLLGYEVHEPIIVGKLLDALSYFAHFLTSQASQLSLTMLQKVFSFVTFTLPNEPKTVERGWMVSEDTSALRRKACVSLLRLGIPLANVLGSIYGDIAREIQRLVDSKLVSYSEKVYLTEFLVAISFHCTQASGEQKMQLYKSLFDPMVAEIMSQDIAECVSSVPVLVKKTGLVDMLEMYRKAPVAATALTAPLKDQEFATKMAHGQFYRAYLLYCINAYKQCLSRTVRVNATSNDADRARLIQQSPWAMHIGDVLTQYLQFTKVCHEMWDPSILGQILPAELTQHVTGIGQLEKSIILGTIGVDAAEMDKNTDRSPTCLADYLRYYQNWLRLFRESLYTLLMQMAYVPTFYHVPNLPQLLVSQLFGSVGAMKNHHWRALNHFVIKPIVMSCPKERLADVLGGFLPHLIGFMSTRLESEWKEVVKRGLVQGTLEEAEAVYHHSEDTAHLASEVSDEILNQKVLRDLTRSWIDIWTSVFLPHHIHKEKSAKTAKHPVAIRPAPEFGAMTDLVNFVVGVDAIARPLLAGITGAMKWKDTKSCMQVAKVMNKLLGLIANKAEWHAFICQDLLFAALSVCLNMIIVSELIICE